MSKKEEWIWMPHSGHLCVGADCRFHLATYVGGFIVSTVGEWLPDESSREIFAESKGITLKGRGDERRYDFIKRVGYEEIGLDRKYETMVFFAKPSPKSCCPYKMESGSELDMDGYNDPVEAFNGHMKMCKLWAKKDVKKERAKVLSSASPGGEI